MIFYTVYSDNNVSNQRKVMAESAFQAVRVFLDFHTAFDRNDCIIVEVPKDCIQNESGFKATKSCIHSIDMVFEVGIIPTLDGWKEVILFNHRCDWAKLDDSKIVPLDLFVGELEDK